MRMPSSVQMKSLEKAAVTYGRSLTLATGYLSAKGIPDLDVVTGWRLGVVESPEPGHDQYVGRLAIPYLNRAGVVGFKFRCLSDHDCKSTRLNSSHGSISYAVFCLKKKKNK